MPTGERRRGDWTEHIMAIKFPNVNVKLVGEDGNVFSIMGRCTLAMRRAGVPKSERDAFIAEMTSGDYDHALQTVMAWVGTDGESETGTCPWCGLECIPDNEDNCPECGEPVDPA